MVCGSLDCPAYYERVKREGEWERALHTAGQFAELVDF